jgi:phasin family protein
MAKAAQPKANAKAKAKGKRTSPAAAQNFDTSLAGRSATDERIVTMTENTAKSKVEDFGAKAADVLTDVTAKAKAAFEKTGALSKDVVEFHKANLDAFVESGKLAAKGLQDVATHNAEIGKKRWEETTAHAKALAAIKSPTDFMSAQADFFRAQFDASVADLSKSTEFYLKLAGEIAQPVQNRYAAAAETMKAQFAA